MIAFSFFQMAFSGYLKKLRQVSSHGKYCFSSYYLDLQFRDLYHLIK